VPVYRIALNKANYFNNGMVDNEAKVLSKRAHYDTNPFKCCTSCRKAVNTNFKIF